MAGAWTPPVSDTSGCLGAGAAGAHNPCDVVGVHQNMNVTSETTGNVLDRSAIYSSRKFCVKL